jgi:hypothetical protein
MAALGQKKTLAVQQPMSPNSGHAGQKRTKHIRQKSSPSQGKIKGFFKIAGSPAATASAQPQSMRRTGPCGSARE